MNWTAVNWAIAKLQDPAAPPAHLDAAAGHLAAALASPALPPDHRPALAAWLDHAMLLTAAALPAAGPADVPPPPDAPPAG